MKLRRYPTQAEWDKIVALGPGVRNYRGKKTLFYNGEKLYEGDWYDGELLIYDYKERQSWEVIIVLPGVEVIPEYTFYYCRNIKVVIMTDSVQRIEESAFQGCKSLDFVRLSRNLEYIGITVFFGCYSLTSIYIPPSCREIDNEAFHGCRKLIILSIPPHTQLGYNVIADTALIKISTFETNEHGYYDSVSDTTEVNAWIKSINDSDGLALHRICSSDNPDREQVYGYMKDHGVRAMKLPNSIGITPSQYLAANPYSEIDEVGLIKRYVLERMGEVVQGQVQI
ncbi:leucine-rich repeat domain-containing protein [Chaetoceros tenuissimus]|uniref:Leucine-rich repeat domain-containing protein n=1 Tax=Chaetoceros tenuissimus TaxID=426638 RepID=A0AAD3H1I3_9STRA|nr:leucine-rich repeat domain-containing protein [Chaetoceros tenuissimus]